MTADTLVAHLRHIHADLHDRDAVRDHGTALARIVSTALAATPAAGRAGLTLADDRYRAAVAAAPAPLVGPLDARQAELDRSPARAVLSRESADGVVVVADFAGRDRARWPEFSGHALDAGWRAMLSLGMEVGGVPRAALNLYSQAPGAFGPDERRVGGLLALGMGMLLLAADHAEQLTAALARRDVIGRAKGVLMERFQLDQGAAFARLVSASQETNLRLADVARWVDEQCGVTDAPPVRRTVTDVDVVTVPRPRPHADPTTWPVP
ncbi:ANTAR domain-containing protein [Actinomycetospora flava]|uniref:ANTAR domain-containing protein n=1 Tax=Actinomycetospora flava TaxID=3129232 RepID=A0ABU8MAD2_9PSEU